SPQSPVHLDPHSFPTRRSSDLFPITSLLIASLCGMVKIVRNSNLTLLSLCIMAHLVTQAAILGVLETIRIRTTDPSLLPLQTFSPRVCLRSRLRKVSVSTLLSFALVRPLRR